MFHTQNDVIGFDALYESMQKCKRGVMWKDSTASIALRGVERVAKLARDLLSGAYRPNPTKHFKITSPKPREIASISFRDRVYQRSLNDNVVYPEMTKFFIYDNYACQIGKGTDAARERLKYFLRNYYHHYGNEGYVAQFDIRGYYPNMRHSDVEAMFKKKLEPWAFERVRDILRSQYEGDFGYNPGSQLVQIAGISALNDFDHFVKEKLRVRYYIRYMDDFLMISNDPETIELWVKEATDHLEAHGFALNEQKTRIYKISCGIPFLGFIFSLTDTGKVLMQIRSENVKAKRRQLQKLVRLSRNGGISRKNVDDSYNSWKVHAGKGNNQKLLDRMDRYYKELWR